MGDIAVMDKIMETTESKDISISAKESQLNVTDKQLKAKSDDEPWIPDEAKKKYHEQRLNQSKWAFRLSFWGSIAGFIVLSLSIWWSISTGKVEWAGIVPGTVIEAVSVLFFTLSNKANDKITEFFKELTKDSNVKKSIELIESVKNNDVKDMLIVKLSLYLSGIDEERICKNTNEICKQGIDED